MCSGVGLSRDKDGKRAGMAAAKEAMAKSGPPTISFLFTAGNYDPAEVLTGVQSIIGPSKLVGASTYGIITRGGVCTAGGGVCCLGGPNIRATTYLEKSLSTVGSAYAGNFNIVTLSHQGKAKTVFVFPDGFGNNISALLRQLHDSMGPGYSYAGGGTGDNLDKRCTYQLTDEGVTTGGFSLATVYGVDFEFGLGHGWQPTGEPMLVTRAEGKRVYELDGVTAFSRYASSLAIADSNDFSHVSMKYPLGILCRGGEFLLRDPLQVGDDGSIVFVTEIPPNTVVTIMTPPPGGDVSQVKSEILYNTYASAPKAKIMFVFDCVSRYFLLGEAFERNLTQALAGIEPTLPVFGCLSFGEISSISGAPLFYNKCITAVVGG